jgi:hypothetical protein
MVAIELFLGQDLMSKEPTKDPSPWNDANIV